MYRIYCITYMYIIIRTNIHLRRCALHCCQQYYPLRSFPARHTYTLVFFAFQPVESVFLLLLFPNDTFYSNPNTTSITYRSALIPFLLPQSTTLINIYLYGLRCACVLTGHRKTTLNIFYYVMSYV